MYPFQFLRKCDGIKDGCEKGGWLLLIQEHNYNDVTPLCHHFVLMLNLMAANNNKP